MKPKTEVRLCVENYAGKVKKYGKRDRSHAEKDAEWYRARATETITTDPSFDYYNAVLIETREVQPWGKVEGSETRR